MRKVIYPYNPGSQSAKLLAAALECKRIKHRGSLFRGNYRTLAINWGSSSLPREVVKCTVLNQPHAVARAQCKLETFKRMPLDVPVPKWTDDPAIAKVWYDEGKLVVGRATTRGSEGKGIKLMRNRDLLIDADGDPINRFDPSLPLYTLYFPKTGELRVHVFKDKVIDFSAKKKRRGANKNFKIRNTGNGFVFTREGVVLPDGVGDACIRAVKALGLDFGACDVAVGRDGFVILEINTAPGIEGTTVQKYKEAILNAV